MKKSMMDLRGSVLFALLFLFAMALVGTILSGEAFAQVRPAMVRSLDEPARVPYYYSLQPTCPFGNECVATFPSVPTGKRLRLTNVRALFLSSNFPTFLAVNMNATGNLLVAFPLNPFNGFFYGTLLSISQDVDLIFEAGETPVLELGSSALTAISNDSRNRLGVTGYLVDLLP